MNALTEHPYWVKSPDDELALLVQATGKTDENGSRLEAKVIRNLTDAPQYKVGETYWFNTLVVSQ